MDGIGSARLSHLYFEEFQAIKKGGRRSKQPQEPPKQQVLVQQVAEELQKPAV